MKNLYALSLVLLVSVTVASEPAVPAPAAKEAMAKAAQVAKETAQVVTENAGKAAGAIAGAAKNVAGKVQEAVQPACDGKGIRHSVEHMFKDGLNFANAKLALVTSTFKTFRVDGWKALNNNQKIGVVVAGSALVAASAYVVCKLYKAVTKTDKTSPVRVTVKQARV